MVYFLYILAILFISSTAILESGLDLETHGSCRAAIYLCLLQYVAAKVIMQMFLVERAHAVRAYHLRRIDDSLWVVGMLVIGFGFGSIAVVAFIFPMAELSRQDGKCRIGLPLKVTVPLLTYDILINAGLTGVFIWLLRPLLRLNIQPTTPAKSSRPSTYVREASCASTDGAASDIELARPMTPPPADAIYTRRLHTIRRLIIKSLIGGVLVLIPTAVNLGVLYRVRGREQGWLCFMACTLDGKSIRVQHMDLALMCRCSDMAGMRSALAYRQSGRRGEDTNHIVAVEFRSTSLRKGSTSTRISLAVYISMDEPSYLTQAPLYDLASSVASDVDTLYH